MISLSAGEFQARQRRLEQARRAISRSGHSPAAPGSSPVELAGLNRALGAIAVGARNVRTDTGGSLEDSASALAATLASLAQTEHEVAAVLRKITGELS